MRNEPETLSPLIFALLKSSKRCFSSAGYLDVLSRHRVARLFTSRCPLIFCELDKIEEIVVRGSLYFFGEIFDLQLLFFTVANDLGLLCNRNFVVAIASHSENRNQ